MNTTATFSRTLVCALAIAIQGCALSTHPVARDVAGKPSGAAELERLIDLPGPITLDTINSADWSVPLAGLINLDSPAAAQAGLRDREEAIEVYAHVLRHPRRGVYLVDTGVSQQLLSDPAGAGLSWLVRKGMPIEKIRIRKNTAAIVGELPGPLAGVLFTHLHLDHISGMPDIPADVPLYVGRGESTERNLANMMVQGSSDTLLKGRQPLQEWDFQPDPQGRFEAVVDVFGDASVFAISVPGHTPGSTAYLLRTTRGPVLLTGDTCHTRWGWEHTVEPGGYTRDNPRNLRNLQALKALVARHPAIEVRLGHQR